MNFFYYESKLKKNWEWGATTVSDFFLQICKKKIFFFLWGGGGGGRWTDR